MALPNLWEKKWPTVIVAPISIANFVVTCTTTKGLHTKQIVVLSAAGQESKEFEIKRVLSDTQIHIGDKNTNLTAYLNPIEFNGGMLTMSEQNRNPIASEYIFRNVYAEEPIIALRTINTDQWGQYYTVDNPMPVQLSDGSINIETLNANLSVQLTHLDNYPTLGDVHDSIRIGGPNGTEMIVNLDGSINTLNIPDTLKPKVDVLAMPLANTEYSYAFPSNTRKFTIKIRENKGTLRIYESSMAAEYFTISRGTAYCSEITRYSPLTMYFQTSQPNCELEIIYWAKV